MFHRFSDICYSKCYMLQVFHKDAQEVDAGGAGGSLGRSGPHVRAGSETSTAAPTCTCSNSRMRTTAALRPAWQAWQQQRAARHSNIVRAGGSRRCMHTRAFWVLSSHMGVVSCRSMLCLMARMCYCYVCVSRCTRRVWCYRLGAGSKRRVNASHSFF
jgi:hypothetical protein